MTRIKLCGLTRACDIETANLLRPEYIGFVFAARSRRYVTAERASQLRKLLSPGITAVGVFVDKAPETVAGLLLSGVIDMAQLHGHEDAAYIARLRTMTDKPLIQAFTIRSRQDAAAAAASTADYILLDSGAGSGMTFDWSLPEAIGRPFFLAGGLDAENVAEAVGRLAPYAVDVSSGIETDGVKDAEKMRAFVRAVRGGAET